MDYQEPAPETSTPQQITHTLSIPEVVARFADAGVPRAARTIQTYCKGGTLNCITVPGELGPKYLVSEQSVADRIQEFVQMRDLLGASTPGAMGARRSAFQRAETRTSAQERAAADGVAHEEEAKEIAEIRAKLLTLESDVRARDAFINMLQQEKKDQFDRLWTYTQRIAEQAKDIGRLEERLQISAPVETYPHHPDEPQTEGGL